MKKAVVAATAVIILAVSALAVSLAFGRLRVAFLGKAKPPDSPSKLVLPHVPEETPHAAVPEQPSTDHMVSIIEPVPYFPPPSINLTGAKLGNQRVDAASDIGDIGRIYYHEPTRSLFMTVVEKNTAERAVWKLSPDGSVRRVMAINSQRGEMNIFGDSRGRLYVQHDQPWQTLRSEDDGKTWQVVFEGQEMFWSIADDGKGTLWGTLHSFNSAILYRSTDDGKSWQPWKDFQKLFPEYAMRYAPDDRRFKLRHLHGVVYKYGLLFVGTGDVARFTFVSGDNGETWKKVWDEGFTASVDITDDRHILFGADQLNSHGVGYYDRQTDTTTDVWTPTSHGYSGYIYSMAKEFGVYYAAIHTETNEEEEVTPKFGVIVSADGWTWFPFLEYGPLGHQATTSIYLASAPDIIYTSLNGTLYAFQALDRSWFDNHQPFQKP